MDKKLNLIQTLILEQIKALESHNESLQKEFEYFITLPSLNEKALLSKKNQISTIKNEIRSSLFLFDKLGEIMDLKLKYESLLLLHGISPLTIKLHMAKDIKEIDAIMKETIKKNEFQIPLKLNDELNNIKSDINPEIKYSTKPILGINGLKELASKTQPSFFKQLNIKK